MEYRTIWRLVALVGFIAMLPGCASDGEPAPVVVEYVQALRDGDLARAWDLVDPGRKAPSEGGDGPPALTFDSFVEAYDDVIDIAPWKGGRFQVTWDTGEVEVLNAVESLRGLVSVSFVGHEVWARSLKSSLTRVWVDGHPLPLGVFEELPGFAPGSSDLYASLSTFEGYHHIEVELANGRRLEADVSSVDDKVVYDLQPVEEGAGRGRLARRARPRRKPRSSHELIG